MKMKHQAFCAVAVACSAAAFGQVEYIPTLPGAPQLILRIYACSADGQHLVGWGVASNGWGHAIRWSPQTGPDDLGTFGTDKNSFAWDVSDDGSVVVGEGSSGAFRWENGEMEILPSLPGGPTLTEAASGVSPDGLITVGTTYSANGQEATIWPAGAAHFGLFNVHPTIKPYGAQKITDQGVVIGVASVSGGNEAYVFKNGVIQTLGDLPGGPKNSYALDCTSDGTVVVGYGATGPLWSAVRWSPGGGMQNLGVWPGVTAGTSQANAVTADGWRLIGGTTFDTSTICSGNSSVRAFVWDPIMGMQVLQDIVEEEQGAPLGTHILITAFDCSADGTYVVGEALKLSNCAREGYRAKIKPFCYADCDQSPGHKRTLDAFDFLCFIARFDQQDFYTDCDQNGEHDFFDLLCYINEFGKGCEP